MNLILPMVSRGVINATTPTDLWIKLGKNFFTDYSMGPSKSATDIELGDRRFIVLSPQLYVSEWPLSWTGEGLMRIVGYSSKGSKMTTLRKHYVDEEALEELKLVVASKKNDVFYNAGMNFKMKVSGKGGCLSSMHIVKHKKQTMVFIHAKIAELPRKFVADLVLISDLIRELTLTGRVCVKFQYSCLYYSIVGLRAWVPVLGKNNMDYHGLPVEEPRNYQVGSQEAIKKYRNKLLKIYGKNVLRTGMEQFLSRETGKLVRP